MAARLHIFHFSPSTRKSVTSFTNKQTLHTFFLIYLRILIGLAYNLKCNNLYLDLMIEGGNAKSRLPYPLLFLLSEDLTPFPQRCDVILECQISSFFVGEGNRSTFTSFSVAV